MLPPCSKSPFCIAFTLVNRSARFFRFTKMSVKRPYEDDVSEELDGKIKKARTAQETVKKHSLDSDEEDSDAEDKARYEILADDDIEGQEDGVAAQDGEVKLTPFNMKEELEEGHFDTEGNFHWDKEKLIKDHWLDNIDWVKLKDNKEAVVKSDDDDDSMDQKPASPFDDRSVYRQILAFMEPGETVARTLRRLGGGASLSASERLKRRKAGLSVDPGGDSGKVTELTELANRMLTKTGNMDIYQESFAYIKNRTEQSSSKESNAELDMYADDFDSKEKERVHQKDGQSSTSDQPDEKEPPLMWEYKEDKSSNDIKGPFTSEQMQATAEKLKVEFWVRKVGTDAAFYSSKRVDFDLYT